MIEEKVMYTLETALASERRALCNTVRVHRIQAVLRRLSLY